ncbi:hypothetical protein AURDEDRAFT_188420 [Auricularia subglabra TFB-10046 SS5]|uniref:F-box domain-containing protein n=1 Tax=Auricularia subglabra (strain TFB-10046 / SS5) TaxID=717982 RepID=J0WSM8_AURST|nr:hypothetical protein AURDEDRAFT_188420 [Auricularia subglabra TFB-10046 SS5]
MTVEDSTNSNRFAGDQEASVVREALAWDERERVQLEQRERTALATFCQAEAAFLAAKDAYASAKYFLDDIRTRKAALAESTRRKQGLLHPLRKMPECVLGALFDMAVARAYDDDPRHLCSESAHRLAFTLAAVCRPWRSAALATSQIWRFVHVHVRNGRRNRATADAISTSLALSVQRKRTQHLRLSLDLEEGVANDAAYAGLFKQIGHLLYHSQSLSVFAPNSWTVFRDTNVSAMFDTNVPHLEELDLRAESCVRVLALPEDDDWYDPQDDPDESAHIPFLRHCPQLRDISLGNVETHLFLVQGRSENQVDDALLWAEGRMCTTDLLSSLKLYPALHKLRVEARGIGEPADGRVPPAVSLRSLRVLELHIEHEDIPLSLSDKLRLPKLRTAEIATDGSNPLGRQAMSRLMSVTLSNISTLHFIGGVLDATMDRALGGLQKLEELEYTGGKLCEDVFARTHTQQVQYPALKKLDIVEADVSSDFTGTNLLAFIRARRSTSVPVTGVPRLEQVYVTWDCFNVSSVLPCWDEQFAEAMQVGRT